MDQYDVLLIGLGPISNKLATKFASTGMRVAVISEGRYHNSISLSCDALNWSEVLNRRIFAKVTYLNWRELPKDDRLGRAQLEWLYSKNLETGRIVHLSSSSVYQSSDYSQSESDFSPNLLEGEGNAKQILEQYVLSLSNEKEATFANLRLSNVYGYPLKKGFISESLENLRKSKPLKVYFQTDLIRDYVHIDDVAVAIFSLHDLGYEHDAVNISTSTGVKISQIVKQLRELSKIPIEIEAIDSNAANVLHSVLDSDLLKSLIPWSPRSTEAGIRLEFESIFRDGG